MGRGANHTEYEIGQGRSVAGALIPAPTRELAEAIESFRGHPIVVEYATGKWIGGGCEKTSADFVAHARALGFEADYLQVSYDGDFDAHAVALIDGEIVVDWTAMQCDHELPHPAIYAVRREGETLQGWYEGQWGPAQIDNSEF